MTALMLLIGFILAIAIVAASFRVPSDVRVVVAVVEDSAGTSWRRSWTIS